MKAVSNPVWVCLKAMIAEKTIKEEYTNKNYSNDNYSYICSLRRFLRTWITENFILFRMHAGTSCLTLFRFFTKTSGARSAFRYIAFGFLRHFQCILYYWWRLVAATHIGIVVDANVPLARCWRSRFPICTWKQRMKVTS